MLFPAALKSASCNLTGNLRNLRQDETKAYQQQMGRWSKDVMKGIKCEVFWRLMELTQICRKPLDGFSHFVAKRRDPETPSNLARLVWGKIDVFTAELAKLTRPDAWGDFLDDVPLAEVRMWQTVINKITFKHLVAFDLRIAQKIKGYPHKLLLLAKSPHTTVCESRRMLCQTLMSTSNDLLHITALKVKWCFAAELTHSAQFGTLCLDLWVIIWSICVSWRPDVQEIEGVNNVIQQLCNKCPHIALPLVDARVALCKQIGLGSRCLTVVLPYLLTYQLNKQQNRARQSADVKWSTLQPAFDEMLEDAVQFSPDVPSVLGTPGRFAVVTGVKDVVKATTGEMEGEDESAQSALACGWDMLPPLQLPLLM